MIGLIIKQSIEELKALLINQLNKIVSKSNKSVTQMFGHWHVPVTIQFMDVNQTGVRYI